MVAIAGDSAAGKTTITAGLVRALGADQCTAVCVDDYHRYDRRERKELPFTALHPECNYVEIMEQHLQLLATGHPVLKPVYDHRTGPLARPEYVEPQRFVIVEGLLPLHTKLAAACFDVTVYLNPPEVIRREWKVRRDSHPARLHAGAGARRAGPARAGIGGVHPPAAPPRRHRHPGSPRSSSAPTRRARRSPPSCCCARASAIRT